MFTLPRFVGHNEMLLRQVLKERRDEAFVSVKFGGLRAPPTRRHADTPIRSPPVVAAMVRCDLFV